MPTPTVRLDDPILRDIAAAVRSHPTLTTFAKDRMVKRLRDCQQLLTASDAAPDAAADVPPIKKGR